MPPPHPFLLASFLKRRREVGCLCRLAGLASLEDWHCSYLCSELVPSVAKRSVLFVKELSFPQTAPTDEKVTLLPKSMGRWEIRDNQRSASTLR